ncbi:hypothetical protein [Herbaspirillum sp.]|uniref:hypothetical protein n=1 Tax=Herbaspirillum sp. TaxID=1890675 RepID=UPI002579DC71|nr:hypothetical protein [Herbaspirillum sp.]|tara:strand:+ start:950 stop:1126 length:177 start_codon:yes stop_codon:yes gene_type:complete
MANEFKQKQDQAKLDKLEADCKAMLQHGGAIERQRAILAYSKGAGVNKEQAERALGLR